MKILGILVVIFLQSQNLAYACDRASYKKFIDLFKQEYFLEIIDKARDCLANNEGDIETKNDVYYNTRTLYARSLNKVDKVSAAINAMKPIMEVPDKRLSDEIFYGSLLYDNNEYEESVIVFRESVNNYDYDIHLSRINEAKSLLALGDYEIAYEILLGLSSSDRYREHLLFYKVFASHGLGNDAHVKQFLDEFVVMFNHKNTHLNTREVLAIRNILKFFGYEVSRYSENTHDSLADWSPLGKRDPNRPFLPEKRICPKTNVLKFQYQKFRPIKNGNVELYFGNLNLADGYGQVEINSNSNLFDGTHEISDGHLKLIDLSSCPGIYMKLECQYKGFDFDCILSLEGEIEVDNKHREMVAKARTSHADYYTAERCKQRKIASMTLPGILYCMREIAKLAYTQMYQKFGDAVDMQRNWNLWGEECTAKLTSNGFPSYSERYLISRHFYQSQLPVDMKTLWWAFRCMEKQSDNNYFYAEISDGLEKFWQTRLY